MGKNRAEHRSCGGVDRGESGCRRHQATFSNFPSPSVSAMRKSMATICGSSK
jgi:hypothetical protein